MRLIILLTGHNHRNEIVKSANRVMYSDNQIGYNYKGSITAKTSYDRIGSFVAIDTETTGLSAVNEDIIEVAAIRFEDWEPVELFQTLVNPQKHISGFITDINGINDAMVKDSPTFAQIIDCLAEFVGHANIVGHNLPFDLKFLFRHGYNFTTEKRKYFDTCKVNIQKNFV